MAVINTNYLALISQNNLTKSQSALGTAIERLSSGLRINSAKDDAAGQAIANRFTANVRGLSQASRNANDGISIAQTTEGALNEINNNLQRIRELSVQAANSSNSPSDLKSIQDEIQQRMGEIDRVSKQTQFNGVDVLASNQNLKIQVGANDSQTIDIELKQINSSTLGIDKLNMGNQLVSKDASGASNFNTVTWGGFDPTNVADVTDPFEAAIPPQWESFDLKASGNALTYSGFVVDTSNNLYVIGTDGVTSGYYAATFDADNNTITVSGTSTTLAASAINSGATYFDNGAGAVDITDINTGMIPADGSVALGDVYMHNPGSDGATAYYVISDGGANFYAATLNKATGEVTYDLGTKTAISAGTPVPGVVVTSQQVLAEVYVDATPYNLSAVDSALATGTNTLVKDSANGEFYIKNVDGSNTTYYAATVNSTTGDVTFTGGTPDPIATGMDMSAVDTALGGTNTLVRYQDGSATYIKNVAADGTTKYFAAEYDPDTGVVAAPAAADEVVVDPLAAIDRALQQVDNLRSGLGAVQNRFESTIANLSNTVANLSAARSRIEDADYAVEVSNMTRAQILQQAGTAVLAQANQVPQTMLSLLR